MKQFVKKLAGVAVGFALVAPWALANAPSSVNGSLGGFSQNAQGGQSPGDWGVPQSSGGQSGAGQASNQSTGGQSSAGQQNSQTGGGQNGPGQQNSQSGSGQNGPGQQNSQNGSGQSGPGQQNSQSGSGQNGPGQQNASGDGQGPHANDGPTKNNSNNPDGSGNGQGEHANDGPTKNNSNNPDGSGDGRGEHYDDGPTKNNSNNPDNGSGDGHGEHYDDGPTKNNSNNPDGDGSGSARGENGSGSSGRGNGSSSSGSSSGGGGSNDGSGFPPLDPSADGPYDPSQNDGGQEIPSGCAEAGAACAQCLQHADNAMKFNRRYLHVAWSVTHQTLDMTKKAIALGDSVSGIHSAQGLAWQLAGKPQITEAVDSLRKTYDAKYRIYINNIEQALNAMNECEQDNRAAADLYQRFSSLYLEFMKARYASPD